MNDTYLVIFVTVALCGVALRVLTARSKSTGGARGVRGAEALPAARHYAYFPQICQALSRADSEYLLKSAPAHVAKRALRERRAVARHYLEGLHEDFSNLARLARIIAAMSPKVSHRQEAERLALILKFQILYALVWFRLSAGVLPLHQLELLTGLVGRLALRMDEAMTEITASSAGQVPGRLGA